ncbi:MAG TPA: imidazole glycerol phosphate synthase subunit HisH [Actinomycetota bacterium]|nr:imidazole glycerol phosphate synthase subunit HisH [Actinomycetota bacterium]
MRAGIVDYRMGNLASVAKALEKVGAQSFVSPDPDTLGGADLVVLPGVGNFAAGMANLRHGGLDAFVKDWAGAGRPLLGICMGMQMFLDHSEEGDTAGLGIVAGSVVRLRGDVKVPHMGWNTVSSTTGFLQPFEGKHFYFVHSYACVPAGEPAAVTTYAQPFASAVIAGNVVGVQFHPEKSSHDGLALLRAALGAICPA